MQAAQDEQMEAQRQIVERAQSGERQLHAQIASQQAALAESASQLKRLQARRAQVLPSCLGRDLTVPVSCRVVSRLVSCRLVSCRVGWSLVVLLCCAA